MNGSELLTLVFSDLVGSTALKRERGDQVAGALIGRHRELITSLIAGVGARVVDWSGDGCFLTFDAPSSAVVFALALQDAHASDSELPKVRIGIHLGEVTVTGARVEGFAVDTAARVCSLALPGQVLLSGPAFDSARQRLRSDASGRTIEWRAHGHYELKGHDEPVTIGEAGHEGVAPLVAPPDSEKARRNITVAQEETLGWRPAVGLHVPGRQNWILEQPLGEGGFGEVWLASHEKTRARRVFKFCFEPERIRGLRREVVLFRLLRETLGARPDIAQILDWEFNSAPYFIESEYTEGGDLRAWAEARGGLPQVPLSTRIELVAQAADALGAAHSVGVLHKDIKPANILVTEKATGAPQACLTDFGIGLITDPEALRAKNITAAGLTQTLVSSSTPDSGAGTRMYMAPEIVEGKPASTLSDIYALGVVLYQMISGDFSRALATGWERDIADELLREDIAACADGDPARRLPSATELAKRLRSLDERRAERKVAAELIASAEKAARRRQQFVALSVIGAVVTFAIGIAALREMGLRQKETQSRHDAEFARDEAMNARDEAMAARAESERLRREAEYRNYVSNMRLADVALTQGNPSQARAILRQSDPEYRGWEWGNLALEAWPNINDASAPVLKTEGSAAVRWRGANAPLFRYLSLHSASVSSLSFSPDGTLLATMGYDGATCMTRWMTGEVLWKVTTPQVGGGGITISHDGKSIAIADNVSILVRDVLTGEETIRLNGHTEGVAVIQFTQDDSTILSLSLDRTARAWDWRAGRELWKMPLKALVERIAIHASILAIMPDQAHFIFSDDQDRFHTGDMKTGQVLSDYPWTLPAGYIPAVLNPNADTLLIYNPEVMLIRVLDIATGKVRDNMESALSLSPATQNGVFSADGSIAFFRGILGGIATFDMDRKGTTSPEASVIVRGLSTYQMMDALAISPNASYVAAPQVDGSVFIFALSGEERTGAAMMQQTGPVYVARFDPVHRQLASADLNGGVQLWDLDKRTLLRRWKGHKDGVTELELSPDCSRWLTGSYDGNYALWSADSDDPIATFKNGIPNSVGGGVKGPLVRLASSLLAPHHFSPDGKHLALANGIGTAQVMDASTLQPIFSLTGHKSWLYRCYYSPKGTMILTHGYQEPFVKIWDAQTGKERFTLHADAQVISTAISPDETMVIGSTLSSTIMRWNLADGKELPRLTVPASATLTVYFSPDGKLFVTGETDGSVMLWNTNDGTLKATLTGHSTNVLTARFSPSGDRVMSAAYDKTVRVWDLAGNELSLLNIGEDIHFADWSPDGNQIVVTTIQGSVKVYDTVPWPELSKLGGAETSIEDKLMAWRDRTAITQ